MSKEELQEKVEQALVEYVLDAWKLILAGKYWDTDGAQQEGGKLTREVAEYIISQVQS